MSGQELERMLPLQLTAASQLERNRVVKISSGVPAYPGYGDEAVGVTRARGDANDYRVDVLPFTSIDRTFFVRLAGTVTANALVFPTGAVGAVKAADYTAISRNLAEPASPTEGDIYIVPAGIDWESGSHQNKKAVRGASSWTYTAATAGDVALISDEGIYVIFNGTTWVETHPVGRSQGAGSSGEEVVCYIEKTLPKADLHQIGQIFGATMTVCSGQSDSENDADAEVVITDDRILATDWCICTIGAQAGTAYIQAAACSANTLTVTLSANGGAGTIINYAVLRQAS